MNFKLVLLVAAVTLCSCRMENAHQAPQVADGMATDVPTLLSANTETSWSFRLSGGLRPTEGLLQVLPPHESEWGTVCGNSYRMHELIRSGVPHKTAIAAFFSPKDALVACRSAGFHVTSATAFRLSREDGWGTGPAYMSHVDCSSLNTNSRDRSTTSLAECYFALSLSSVLKSDCDRSDDVYLKCENNTIENSAADTADFVKPMSLHRNAMALDASATLPTSVILVVRNRTWNATGNSTAAQGLRNLTVAICYLVGLDHTYYSRVQISTIMLAGAFSYFSVSFQEVVTPAPSALEEVTAAPSGGPPATYLMLQLVTSNSVDRDMRDIVELRTDSSADYGDIDTSPNVQPMFKLDLLGAYDFMGNDSNPFTNVGFVRAQSGINNKIGGSICGVDAATRVVTASYICGALQFDTVPSLMIPYFGNSSGLIIFSNFRVISTTAFGRTTSTYYSKANSCNNAQTYGLICGAQTFQWSSMVQFCATNSTPFKTFREGVLRELLIAPYRIRMDSASKNQFCFHAGYSYSFKDTTLNIDFDPFDIQFILGSINAAGYQNLFNLTDVTLSIIPTPDYVPVQPVQITFEMATHITAQMLVQAFLTRLQLDDEDIIVMSDTIDPEGSLPLPPDSSSSEAAPTSSPLPPTDDTPAPRHRMKRNRTVSQTLEVTLTLSASQTITKRLGTGTVGPTPAPTPQPTDVPGVRMVTLQFMFQDPAFQAYSLIKAQVMFAGMVFVVGQPVLITPAPPPPNKAPLIAGTTVAAFMFLVFVVIAIIAIKRYYYTRTSKRWDDDYVMMNMQVLTVPLNEMEMETPKRRTRSNGEELTGDRDTGELL